MPMYELLRRYWRHDDHTFMVTDDLMTARSALLMRIEQELGKDEMMKYFAGFERGFDDFAKGRQSTLWFAVGDYSYTLREAQMKVAVGGMSTIW